MFPKTKQNHFKVPGYKPATFVKLNFSQIVFKNFSKQTFVFVKTFWRRLQCNIFFVFQGVSKTSSRHLQDVFARCLLEDVLKKTSCKHVLKKSWSVRNCYAENVFNASWKTKSVCWVNYQLPRFIFLGFRNIYFQGIIVVVRAAS